jgi:alpha-galactosidase
VIHLRGNGLDAIVEVSDGTPRIVHWGTPLDDRDLEGIAEALDRPTAHGSPDAVAPASVVPEHGAGWPGRPGLLGHRRRGAHWAPRFTPSDHHVADTGEGQRLTVVARDEVAALTMTTIIEVADAMVVRAELRNDQAADRYLLDQLALSLPVPQHAAELATFTGRWTREFHPTRTPWPHGSHIAENRRGRTSHEHPPLLFTGTPGFGEWSGEVWGTHLAWSGNHAWLAERLADGRRHVQMGELLHPGEISLEPGESYLTPELIAVWSDAGLTPATQRFHRHLRARPAHPTSPRPVLVNTWEAVYFDHDLDTLRALADRAARVGVERFVLDPGWVWSSASGSSPRW